MNWLAFIAAAYISYALQGGLAPLWTLNGITPNLLLVLMIFVGLHAPRSVTLVAAMILGLLMDLRPGPLASGGALVGPHTLGFLIGGYATLQLRNLLVRGSVITLVLLTFIVGSFTALTEVLLYSLRGLPMLAGEPMPWRALPQLLVRGQGLIYSAVLAVPLGLLLKFSIKSWGFTTRSRGEKIF